MTKEEMEKTYTKSYFKTKWNEVMTMAFENQPGIQKAIMDPIIAPYLKENLVFVLFPVSFGCVTKEMVDANQEKMKSVFEKYLDSRFSICIGTVK